MYRIFKIVILAAGIVMQAAAVIMFGFAELEVSCYVYMAVWILCSLLIRCALRARKAN